MLSRLIYGARLSLIMGVIPVPIAFIIGSTIGIIAGYAGGIVNTLIMRTIDVFYAFPSVLLGRRPLGCSRIGPAQMRWSR